MATLLDYEREEIKEQFNIVSWELKEKHDNTTIVNVPLKYFVNTEPGKLGDAYTNKNLCVGERVYPWVELKV